MPRSSTTLYEPPYRYAGRMPTGFARVVFVTKDHVIGITGCGLHPDTCGMAVLEGEHVICRGSEWPQESLKIVPGREWTDKGFPQAAKPECRVLQQKER